MNGSLEDVLLDVSAFETKIDVEMPGDIPVIKAPRLSFVVTVVSATNLPDGPSGWSCTVSVDNNPPNRIALIEKNPPLWNAIGSTTFPLSSVRDGTFDDWHSPERLRR
jgi:hypothetical protein